MNAWDGDRRARAALAASCGAGHARLSTLVAEEGAESLWQTLRQSQADSGWAVRARGVDPAALEDRTHALGLRFIVPTDDEWPAALDELMRLDNDGMGGSPLGLWLRGPARLDECAAVGLGVVGSRAASPYGERVAADVSAELSDPHGEAWCIISGGAYGIDAAAHRGALAAGGVTVTVQAGGLDQWYPSGNRHLLEQVSASGLAVSELPPGATPTKPGFLARNRLIAALSSGLLLVEAALRSGAVNTVRWALDLGRPVMAVPGPVTSAMSMSPHRLIREQAATLVMDASQVRETLGPLRPERLDRPSVLHRHLQPRLTDDLSPEELTVREALPARGGVSIDDLVVATGLAAPVCLTTLMQLQDWDLARRLDDGSWGLKRP